MIRLFGLIRKHPAALEADLVRFAAAPTDLDLTAATAGPWTVSLGWLLRRTRHIPHGQGAAIYTLNGPEWSIEADLLDTVRRWYIARHSEAGDDPGPHPLHPIAEADGPTVEGVELAKRLKAERQAAIDAGEL